MSDEQNKEPKLIIDEDWKSQVQREKEEMQRQQASGGSPLSGSSAGGSGASKLDLGIDPSELEAATDQASGSGDGPQQLPPPPEASFPLLVTTLASQAMAALGQIPGDDGQPLPVNLDYARHFIDLVDIMETKTKGNLTEEESVFVTETLHQLRMLFVAVSQQQSDG